ncbi:hypothetical protein C8Q74DRAFT_1263737 [Fomes fomentarius]|nr:hypothetical protein C8Q74DRAFT_1263737 [Fomes fomentarius]
MTLTANSNEVSDNGLPDIPGGVLEESVDGNEDMDPFWLAYRDWLAVRGFKLFERRRFAPGTSELWWPPPSSTVSPLPYAIRRREDVTMAPHQPHYKIVFAQDNLGRDVVLKVAKKESNEYRIYQKLLGADELFQDGDFRGVLPPVAILDTAHGFSVIVMPMWGAYNPLQTLETVGQVVHFMSCILKGLAFLHNLHVVHRDIDDHNIMTNFYSVVWYGAQFATPLRDHRRDPRTQYALIDFNLSIIFDEDASQLDCRLPAEAALVSATPFQPSDLWLGEYDYDPFAYDVGCLGNMFRVNFAEVVPSVPLLAPLFDKMTTHVKSRRFKAQEALLFLQDIMDQLPSHVLNKELALQANWTTLDNSTIYWSRLPPRFCTAWALYKTPSPSRFNKLLHHIACLPHGQDTLRYFRRILRC